jgi:hypothetical protein
MTVNDKLIQLVAKWYCDTDTRLLVAEDDRYFYAAQAGMAVRVGPHPFSARVISLRDNVGAPDTTQTSVKQLFEVDMSGLKPLLDLEETRKFNGLTGCKFSIGDVTIYPVYVYQAYIKAVTAGAGSVALYGKVDDDAVSRVYVTRFGSDEVCAVIEPLRKRV